MKAKLFWVTCVLFLLTSSVPAQTITAVVEDKTKKIEVTGSAEMRVVPDELYVNFTLQEYYNKQKVKISIDDISKDFLQRCEKAGITKDRIQVQNMSGFDQSSWYWRKRKKEQPDMVATTTYVIKFSDAGSIDKLVNTLDDNATQNMYISKTSHSKMEEYRKEIKIKALQAAKAKATYLCESINEKIGNTLTIQEIEENYYAPMYMAKGAMSNAMMDSESTANSDIDFQKITIRYEMRAQFAIQ